MAGDLVTALAYGTPAGRALVIAVYPTGSSIGPAGSATPHTRRLARRYGSFYPEEGNDYYNPINFDPSPAMASSAG